MTALQNYSVAVQNGSENQVCVNYPYLTEEENALLRRLPCVLGELDALCVPPADDEVYSYYGFISDSAAFLACLFRHYRFLWRVFAIIEDHPSFDFEVLFPDCKNLRVGSFIDGSEVITAFSTFQLFMYVDIPHYSDAYRRYCSTGEVSLDFVHDSFLWS